MKRGPVVLLSAASLLSLTGCAKKVIAAAAPPPPPTATVSVPPPTHPTEPMPEAPVISSTVTIPVEPVRRPAPPRQRVRPTAPTQTATNTAPPVTELGELTTGGESDNDNFRRQTEELLKTQNRRLSGLSAGLAALHAQQVEQARLFLKQAGEAWNKQDVAGARTLAVKAKVLLDEVLS